MPPLCPSSFPVTGVTAAAAAAACAAAAAVAAAAALLLLLLLPLSFLLLLFAGAFVWGLPRCRFVCVERLCPDTRYLRYLPDTRDNISKEAHTVLVDRVCSLCYCLRRTLMHLPVSKS